MAEIEMKGTRKLKLTIGVVFLGLFTCVSCTAADLVEFMNGSKLTGTITSIRKADKEFDFQATVGGRTFMRVYPFGKVHAVTYRGKRFELTPKSTSRSFGRPGAADSSTRSKAAVKAVIAAAGKSAPDWFESKPLYYPKTLDLSWPLKPPTKGWQSQKNMSQYIWSVINENPSRWHSGIKLIHHCVTLHKDDRVLLKRDMNALGSAYFRLLQDYPRAAFWFQKSGATVSRVEGVRLAECYWRLGNRDMALDMLRGKRLNLGAIKLYGDMGEMDRVLGLTKAFNKSGRDYQANILAADALRLSGSLDQAIDYYQRVIDSKNFRNDDYGMRFKARAQESIDAIKVFDQADVTQVADGTYQDSSTGYAGKVFIDVTVADGRIESVVITRHKEKQFYSSLTDTPRQLIDRQSVQGIDGTSGATITSQAIVNATAKALAKGNQ